MDQKQSGFFSGNEQKSYLIDEIIKWINEISTPMLLCSFIIICWEHTYTQPMHHEQF